MNVNEYLAKIMCELLDQGSPVVLASIVGQEGSAPRRTGTKMVISVDGKSYGTLGGSLLEAGVIEEARSVLASGQSRLMDFDLANQDVSMPEMICGGKATVMLDYLSASKENLDFSHGLYDALRRGDDFAFLTLFKGADHAISVIGHCLLLADGRVIGRCPLSESDLERLMTRVRSTQVVSVIPLKDLRVVLDPNRKTKTLYCFGAGHVAKPTVHIAALVGFRVVVVDDRAEFSNAERFPDAWEVRVIDDYSRALEDFDMDEDSFIVIFTRGHLYDRVILEQALKTEAGYIGMIASRKKRDSIYEALLAKGVRKEELARVSSPIGLEIDAETPEEIAVSIVAELIKERSRQGA